MYVETPQYVDLAQGNPRSIVLQPLRPPQSPHLIKKPASYMFLKIALSDDPTGLQIADWLKTYPPKHVTAVTIEALVLKARRLQGLTESAVFPRGSILNKLSRPAQEEFLEKLQMLNTVISTAEKSAQGSLVAADTTAIGKTIDAMSTSVDEVCKAVETPILLEPQFSEVDALKSASENEGATAAEANNAISLRRHLLGIAAIREGLNIPREAVIIREIQSTERFQFGSISRKAVLLESFKYQPRRETGDPAEETVRQLEKMTSLLCQPKRASFHILPCVGYIAEPLNLRYSLLFEVPKGYVQSRPPMKLRDIYKTSPKVALGLRMRLAYALAVGLENFHRVGWVHKEFTSDNVYFLSGCEHSTIEEGSTISNDGSTTLDTPEGEIDVSLPWLFGFEYSRAENANTRFDADYRLEYNIYRHPDRWGHPNVEFTKHHDVYSLVICFSESILPLFSST